MSTFPQPLADDYLLLTTNNQNSQTSTAAGSINVGIQEVLTALIVAAIGAFFATWFKAFRNSKFYEINNQLIEPLEKRLDQLESKVILLNQSVENAENHNAKYLIEMQDTRKLQLQTAEELGSIKANVLAVTTLLGELKQSLKELHKTNNAIRIHYNSDIEKELEETPNDQ